MDLIKSPSSVTGTRSETYQHLGQRCAKGGQRGCSATYLSGFHDGHPLKSELCKIEVVPQLLHERAVVAAYR